MTTRVVRRSPYKNGGVWLIEPSRRAVYLWGAGGDSAALAPAFRCVVCRQFVGGARGSRKVGNIFTVWEPLPCVHCDRRERQRQAAKRRREHPRVLAGVDVDRAVAGLKRLPVFVAIGIDKASIKVDVGHRSTACVCGRAWAYTRRIRIVGGPRATPARVLLVVLHEICHIATPAAGHGERFRRVLQRAAREAWGIEVPIDVDRGPHQNASYKMGEMVTEQLAKLIELGGVETYPPDARPPAASRNERSEALVVKRAKHAADMLARAKRRLKLAQTVHKRWSKRVRYYERAVAAQRAKGKKS